MVLEHIVEQRWRDVDEAERGTVRLFVFECAVARHKSLPSFVHAKLCKVLADIGRLDWPEQFPDFFSHIATATQVGRCGGAAAPRELVALTRSLQRGETRTAGLTLLSTALEELTTVSTARRARVPSTRMRALRKCLS